MERERRRHYREPTAGSGGDDARGEEVSATRGAEEAMMVRKCGGKAETGRWRGAKVPLLALFVRWLWWVIFPKS